MTGILLIAFFLDRQSITKARKFDCQPCRRLSSNFFLPSLEMEDRLLKYSVRSIILKYIPQNINIVLALVQTHLNTKNALFS